MNADRLPASLLVFLILTGCSDKHPDADALFAPPLPGVYSGTFPCVDCAGIPTRLWLRGDGRFFMRQSYPDDGVHAYNLGRWQYSAADDVVVLAGAGLARRFTRLGPDRLKMSVASELDHVLLRDSVAAQFSDRLGLDGMARVQGRTASFTECFTSLAAPIRPSGDYARFMRHMSKLGDQDKTTFVELEGHFEWTNSGALAAFAIDRFLTVRPGKTCQVAQ